MNRRSKQVIRGGGTKTKKPTYTRELKQPISLPADMLHFLSSTSDINCRKGRAMDSQLNLQSAEMCHYPSLEQQQKEEKTSKIPYLACFNIQKQHCPSLMHFVRNANILILCSLPSSSANKCHVVSFIINIVGI